MKIIILSTCFSPFVGGIEVITDFLAKALVKDGNQVCVITWTKEMSEENHPFEVLRNPSIIALIKKINWANVIVENNPSLKLSWPNIFFRKPLLVVLHTWLFKEGKSSIWNTLLKKYWISLAHQVLVVSEVLKNECAPNAKVIENPYRANIFKIHNEIPRNKDFVFLGRLVSDKGVDLAIRAIHELKNKNQNFNLTIIGKGAQEKYLKDLALNLGVVDFIDFKGQIVGKELAKLLNQHKFILIPSKWEEPFGMVAIEAMACGCIPIVSQSGGLPEAVGNAGLIFKKNNLSDLVEKIERITTDESMQQNLINNRNLHLEKYHSDKVAKKYVTYINKLF